MSFLIGYVSVLVASTLSIRGLLTRPQFPLSSLFYIHTYLYVIKQLSNVFHRGGPLLSVSCRHLV